MLSFIKYSIHSCLASYHLTALSEGVGSLILNKIFGDVIGIKRSVCRGDLFTKTTNDAGISLLGFRMTRNAWLRCHTWVFPGRLRWRHGNCKIGIDRHCLWSCQDRLNFWTTFLSGFNLLEVIELDEESFAVLPFHVVVPRFLYAQGFITVRTLSWSCLFEVLELDVRCFAMHSCQVAVPRWCKRIENKSLQYKMYVWDLVA